MNIYQIVSKTNAFKICARDKKNNTLSHAYLLCVNDRYLLEEYTKVFTKILACDGDPYCDECRTCKLIDSKNHIDILFYPREGEKLDNNVIDDMFSKINLRPMELNKRIVVFNNFPDLEARLQNKLLKVLEEPPENVYFLLTALNEYYILKTVLSRVKKLDINSYSQEEIKEFLKEYDSHLLDKAMLVGDGMLGKVIQFLNNNSEDVVIENIVFDALLTLRKKNATKILSRINKDNFSKVIILTKEILNIVLLDKKVSDLRYLDVKQTLSKQVIVGILDRLSAIEKAMTYTQNSSILIDEYVLGIIEEKKKWQSL